MKVFLGFTCMLCIEKVHEYGFHFFLQKFNLKFKGWRRNQVGGCNLSHYLTQDMPMIPFLYGFQNLVLDEICFFFLQLEFHGFWKICLLSIININDANMHNVGLELTTHSKNWKHMLQKNFWFSGDRSQNFQEKNILWTYSN